MLGTTAMSSPAPAASVAWVERRETRVTLHICAPGFRLRSLGLRPLFLSTTWSENAYKHSRCLS